MTLLPGRQRATAVMLTPTRDGVFLAGWATDMKPIRNCMIDGAAVAARVTALLREATA